MSSMYSVKIILLISILSSCKIYAQNSFSDVTNAKGNALGGTSSIFQGVYSIFNNPSGISQLDETALLLSGERRFLLEEINMASLAIVHPTKAGNFGLTLQYFGFQAYNEQQIGISYARQLSKNLSIGGRFRYNSLRIVEYGTKNAITFDLGLQYRPFKKWQLGTYVSNPMQIQMTETDLLPTVLTVGVAYLSSKRLSIIGELVKDIRYPTSIRAGIDYKIIEHLALRTGFATAPVRNTFGLGLELNHLQIDLAVDYHQTLGITPSTTIVYDFGKN